MGKILSSSAQCITPTIVQLRFGTQQMHLGQRLLPVESYKSPSIDAPRFVNSRNKLAGSKSEIQQIRSQINLGADIATPETDKPALRITAEQVTRLESEIDLMNSNLDPLGSFILPGGSPASAWLHLARTVTRRAERHMTELAAEEVINDDAMRFVNRLSDHLFVLARRLNENGKTDVLWRPGQNSGQN
mgnify:CR=1 FL=1